MATKEPKPKRAPKTLKERRFVKEYLESGNKVQAAMKAYPNATYKSASVIAHENLEKLRIDQYLDAAGLTNEVLAQNTARIALTAKKQNQYTGEIEDDNAIQLRGMEFAAKLKNLINPDSGNTNNGTVNNFNFGELGEEALRALAKTAS